jgi:hypothetical protein
MPGGMPGERIGTPPPTPPAHSATPAAEGRSSAVDAAYDPEGLRVQLRHLTTENSFLRERVAHVEATVQPLLAELSEKRALLHHAYVLAHRALPAAQQKHERALQWARAEHASFGARPRLRRVAR